MEEEEAEAVQDRLRGTVRWESRWAKSRTAPGSRAFLARGKK